MNDNDALLWNHVPPTLTRPSAKRESLFVMTKGVYRLECSLLFHGEFGVEAQFLLDGELFTSRGGFATRADAELWARAEHAAQRADGTWTESV